MSRFANAFGPHRPEATYVAHAFPEQHVRHRRGVDELRGRGRRRQACVAPDPRTDGVVVGLRAGDAAARRALPGVRGRSARTGPLLAHARPLHARQHGQRPGPLPRRRDRATRDRERPLVGRRARGVAVGVREAGPGDRRTLRGSAALHLAGESRVRPVDPPGHRPDVRALEQVPRRSVEHRRLGRHGGGGAARAASVARCTLLRRARAPSLRRT